MHINMHTNNMINSSHLNFDRDNMKKNFYVIHKDFNLLHTLVLLDR